MPPRRREEEKKRRREEEKKWDADERGKTRMEKQRISAVIRAPSVLVRVPSVSRPEQSIPRGRDKEMGRG
jgi:hypothetical protein